MTKEQKQKIEALFQQQVKLYSKLIDIAKGDKPKNINDSINTTIQSIVMFAQIRALEVQKHIIMSQCIPKHKKGCAIIGETSEEEKIIR